MVSKYQPVRKYREKVINKQKENDRYNLGNWKDWS